MALLNVQAYEDAAREIMSQMAYDYVAGGAEDEITLRENRAAFTRVRLLPHILAGIGARTTETVLLRTVLAFPVGVAPVGFHQLAHPDGECATARAAGALGALMCVSTAANYSLERVAEEASGPLWFQLYWYKDRELTRWLVERAAAAGYSALVLTTDTPLLGKRERDIRNHFTLPPGIGWKNLEAVAKRDLPSDIRGSSLAAYTAAEFESNLTWHDLDWLRGICRLPVLLKGVLRADDAVRAAQHGAAGVIVSNHGGRQLDGVVTALDALPAVADAAREHGLAVLLDGGVRRGTDVLKALALGAHAVLVGRPIIWGLAVDGEAGVRAVLEILHDEFDLAMALAGCRRPGEIDASLVVQL